MRASTTTIGVSALLLAFAAMPGGAQELKPIGKIVSVVGKATVEHVGVPVVQAALTDPADARVGDPIYRGDVVKTAADGRLGINFADGSTFNLSSNAKMEMNEFVYDPDGRDNSTLISLTRGTFTFVAGQVAKTGSMKVDTPVATLGIRGTTPHIEIADDGTVRFATLIEEGKDGVLRKKKSAPAEPQPRQRRAERALGICRGC